MELARVAWEAFWRGFFRSPMPYWNAFCCGLMAASYLIALWGKAWGTAAWSLVWGLLMAYLSDRELA